MVASSREGRPVREGSHLHSKGRGLGWPQTSSAEARLASALGRRIHSVSENAEEQAIIIKALMQKMLGLPLESAYGPEAHELLLGLEMPRDKMTQSVASAQDEVTTNVFARLASELAVLRSQRTDSGVVMTPPILAMDMASVACRALIRNRTGRLAPLTERAVFGLRKPHEVLPDEVREVVRSATWYDPCVGGGVFPISFLEVIERLGIPRSTQTLSRVYGMDADPVAVEVTRARLVASLGPATTRETEQRLELVSRNISAGDALATFPEEVSLFTEGASQLHDLVVANPPYVRADRLSKERKSYLAKRYPSVSAGTADLFTYFIAHSLWSLANQGVLCMVSAATFQRSRYGTKIRRQISKLGRVENVFDFDELPVFADASLHPSVYVISRGDSRGDQEPSHVGTYFFTHLPEQLPLYEALNQSLSVPSSRFAESGWRFVSDANSSVVDAMKTRGVSLVSLGCRVLSGVKTGHKRAYVLAASEAAELLEDPASAPYVRRQLRPVCIRAWRGEWDGAYLVVIPKGEQIPSDSVLMKRLRRFEEELRRRTDIRGHATWYGQRECSYMGEFDRAKIVFPDIAAHPRFMLDESSYVIPDGAFMITSDDPYLVAILNSDLGEVYFRDSCATIGSPLSSGRLRFKKVHVERFPIPAPDAVPDRVRQGLRRLAKEFVRCDPSADQQAELNELVASAYGLPPEVLKKTGA